MSVYRTHASVRVKGAEHCYEPIWCDDAECPKRAGADQHLHCPFCPSSEVYLDPIILRAHYRVKHVDKGIDVYGLRVVRCCDRCDIVGSIKGSKEIRGAHWHCFKCRNGFNRRDEAVKHYRTHFRAPHTTYQIQIVSDVNQVFLTKKKISCQNSSVASRVTSTTSSNGAGGQQSVAANETVTTSTGELHLLIVDADDESNVDLPCHDPDTPADVTTVDVPSCEAVSSGAVTSPNGWASSPPPATSSLDLTNQDSELADLRRRYDKMAAESASTVSQLRAEVASLQQRVRRQADELAWLRQCPMTGTHFTTPTSSSVAELVSRLSAQHVDLLQQQLREIRAEFLQANSCDDPGDGDPKYTVAVSAGFHHDGFPAECISVAGDQSACADVDISPVEHQGMSGCMTFVEPALASVTKVEDQDVTGRIDGVIEEVEHHPISAADCIAMSNCITVVGNQPFDCISVDDQQAMSAGYITVVEGQPVCAADWPENQPISSFDTVIENHPAVEAACISAVDDHGLPSYITVVENQPADCDSAVENQPMNVGSDFGAVSVIANGTVGETTARLQSTGRTRVTIISSSRKRRPSTSLSLHGDAADGLAAKPAKLF